MPGSKDNFFGLRAIPRTDPFHRRKDTILQRNVDNAERCLYVQHCSVLNVRLNNLYTRRLLYVNIFISLLAIALTSRKTQYNNNTQMQESISGKQREASFAFVNFSSYL